MPHYDRDGEVVSFGLQCLQIVNARARDLYSVAQEIPLYVCTT